MHGCGSPVVLQVIHPEVYGETEEVTRRNLQAGRWCCMSSCVVSLLAAVCWALLPSDCPCRSLAGLEISGNSLDKMRRFVCNFMQFVHGISSQAHLLSRIVLGFCDLLNIPRDKHTVPWHQSPCNLLVNFRGRATYVRTVCSLSMTARR